MRPQVIGAAVVLAAAIGGVGYVAVSSLSGGSSGKGHGAKAAREADREARGSEAIRGDHPEKPERAERRDKAAPSKSGRAAVTVDAPAEAPAAPKPGAIVDPSAPREARPGDPMNPPGVVDPALPFQPGARPGGAAAPGAGTAGLPQQFFPPAPPGDAGSACPAGMVDIGSFCIDATEVTNASYKAFLDARPSRRLQPPACSWNLDYTPSGGPPPADRRPVVGVDWCDAWLFCAWSGKRLCGRTGGGNNPAGAFNDASRSEWHNACTNGGASAYSYGDTFDGTKCAHASDDGTLAPVGAVASCVGTSPPYDQVFDMSGNAWEWEDSCAGESGEKDLCRVRGGGTHSTSAEVSCAMDYLAKREQTFRSVGIRCCASRRPGF